MQRRGELSNQLQAKEGITIGLQFSGEYFVLPQNYDEYFASPLPEYTDS